MLSSFQSFQLQNYKERVKFPNFRLLKLCFNIKNLKNITKRGHFYHFFSIFATKLLKLKNNETMDEKMRLANNLRILRERLGYTQQEIATYLHISQPAYLKYENGLSEISMNNLEKLSQLYNISEYDIMESNVKQMQVCSAFAFRKNGEILNLEQIAQFQKIVTNYIEMSDELEKHNH